MIVTGERFTLTFDPLDQQVNFEGIIRSGRATDLENVGKYLQQMHDDVEGMLRLNFRKLRYISSTAIRIIADFIRYARAQDKLTVRLVGSKVITWEEKTLPALANLWERVEFSIHDEGFYDSQGIIEDAEFIPLLRNQTRLLWPHEKEVLRKHGLRPGMSVADICCGCGDVPIQIARELHASSVLGVDHSVPAIEYATRMQRDFNVRNVDFRLGDATALMLDDELFDFVVCRLSLQIFSKPEEITSELVRITKPGGRIYLLGEDYDMVVGHPNSREIRDVYEKAGDYGTRMGMDLYNGKKLFSILREMKLEHIALDFINVDTSNSDRKSFGAMIESWRRFSADTIGRELNISDEAHDELLAGYDAHLRTINHPLGYAAWTLVAASGEKRL